jgi:hypothetical protein
MPKKRRREADALAEAVIQAACKVHEALTRLEAARGKRVVTWKYLTAVRAARNDQRLALIALDKYREEHGCQHEA